MGACFSCCGGTDSDQEGKQPFRQQTPDTEQDREARLRAAEQAEARQAQFERSAVGRAAIKSVKDSKKVEQRNTGPSAQDWMS